MKKYRVSCVKNNEKVSLLIAGNDKEAIRRELHKQGYSILEIEEADIEADESGIFYFDIFLDGVEKKWQKIKSNDILQAYIKLKDGLHYNVLAIYDTLEIDEKDKLLITNKVKESYRVYQHETQQHKKIEQITTKQNKEKEDEGEILAKKEIQGYVKLIDRVIDKITFILDKYRNDLASDRISNLENLYVSLKHIKNITNANRLKVVGEKALLKIGEIELEIMNSEIGEEKELILQQTNQLLKDFGSSKKVGKQTSFESMYEEFLHEFLDYFGFSKEQKEEETEEKKAAKKLVESQKVIKKNSLTYYKSLRELNIYRKKLKEVNQALLKSYITFDTEKRKTLLLKKKLIEQNIQLIKNRFYNKNFSYTKIVKGFSFYLDKAITVIRFIGNISLYGIFFYSLIFIAISSGGTLFKYTPYINTSFFFLVVFLSFFTLFSKLIKNTYLLTVFTGLYGFLFIFLIVNL